MTTQSLDLNLIPKGISPRLYVSQYDKGQTWTFNIYAGNTAYTIPNGATVTIQGTKPDKTGFQYSCTASGNVVTATEQQQMTVIAGEVPAEIRITNNNEIIATLNFILVVEPAALTDETEISETDLPIIEQAIEMFPHYQEMIDDVSSDIATLTTNLSAETTARQNADSSEASTRAAADASLREAIDALVSPSGQSVVVDKSLSIFGAAADAKVTGDELNGSDLSLIGRENLINHVTWTADQYINSSGEIGSATNYILSSPIPVESGKDYSFIYSATAGYTRIAGFDSNGNSTGLILNEGTGSKQVFVRKIPSGVVSIRCSLHNTGLVHGFIKGVSVDTEIININRDILIDCRYYIRFDTSNKTITFPKPCYLKIGKQRYNIESADIVIGYRSVSGALVTVTVDSSGNINAEGYTTVDLSSKIALFTFNKNTLKQCGVSNIIYPYYVDGVLYNSVVRCFTKYVDGVNGSDSYEGSESMPFATIQRAIDEYPDVIKIKRGTYNETITINNKNNMQIVPWGTPTYTTGQFDVPLIEVNQVNCSDCNGIQFRDIDAKAPTSNSGAWVINNCTDMIFEHCIARNGEGGGFVSVNLDGKFIQCIAHDVGDSTHYNSDGFNLHGYGTTELIDCIAYNCYDDGISHHDGCICSIKGGECYNCTGGGGIAPVNRYCEIDGVYIHDCRTGIEAMQTEPTQYDPKIVVKNSVMKNNSYKDIWCGDIKFTVLRCTFDTKEIGTNADYTEIS